MPFRQQPDYFNLLIRTQFVSEEVYSFSSLQDSIQLQVLAMFLIFVWVSGDCLGHFRKRFNFSNFRIWQHSSSDNHRSGVLHLVCNCWNSIHTVSDCGHWSNFCHTGVSLLEEIQAHHSTLLQESQTDVQENEGRKQRWLEFFFVGDIYCFFMGFRDAFLGPIFIGNKMKLSDLWWQYWSCRQP